jgi:hypothetical protein
MFGRISTGISKGRSAAWDIVESFGVAIPTHLAGEECSLSNSCCDGSGRATSAAGQPSAVSFPPTPGHERSAASAPPRDETKQKAPLLAVVLHESGTFVRFTQSGKGLFA